MGGYWDCVFVSVGTEYQHVISNLGTHRIRQKLVCCKSCHSNKAKKTSSQIHQEGKNKFTIVMIQGVFGKLVLTACDMEIFVCLFTSSKIIF